jgi:hypothetical protein
MLRLVRKFLGFRIMFRLPVEVRQTNCCCKPSELYTLRENERDVKYFLQYDAKMSRKMLRHRLHADIVLD